MQVNVDGSLAEKETLTSAAFVQAGGAASMVVTGGVRSGSVLSTTNARRLPGSGTQLGVDVRTAAPALASSAQRDPGDRALGARRVDDDGVRPGGEPERRRQDGVDARRVGGQRHRDRREGVARDAHAVVEHDGLGDVHGRVAEHRRRRPRGGRR